MTAGSDISSNISGTSGFGNFLVDIALTDNIDPILVQKLNNNFAYLRDHMSESQVVYLTENIDSSDDYTIEPYELLPATANRLGGIKVGENLTISADGTLDAEAGGDFLYFDEVLF